MENELNKALSNKYIGRIVKEECTDWSCLEDESLLQEKGTIDEGTEITESMSIQIELDDDNAISEIYVGFHTGCWGDSGLGEEDPEDYWSFSECYDAAVNFIENLLA